jgi:hypothetical protein
LIPGRTARQTGEYIQEKIKAVPDRAAFIYPDERPQGSPTGKFLTGGSEPVQDDPVPGTPEVFCIIDDAAGRQIPNQGRKFLSLFWEVFGRDEKPGIPGRGTEFFGTEFPD